MIFIIIIAILILILLFNIKEKKTASQDKIVINQKPIISDEKLAILKVYCCGGREIKRGAIEEVTGEREYEIRGFSIKEEEVKLNPNKISWHSSCSVVHFITETGITNIISCINKGNLKRNIWIKYKYGITFPWKIQFKKGEEK